MMSPAARDRMNDLCLRIQHEPSRQQFLLLCLQLAVLLEEEGYKLRDPDPPQKASEPVSLSSQEIRSSVGEA
jgi:hypothetical protein